MTSKKLGRPGTVSSLGDPGRRMRYRGSAGQRRVLGIAVTQPVECGGEAVAPGAQRRAVGDEVVRAAEAGVLKDREHQKVGVARRGAGEKRLLAQGALERRDDRG